MTRAERTCGPTTAYHECISVIDPVGGDEPATVPHACAGQTYSRRRIQAKVTHPQIGEVGGEQPLDEDGSHGLVLRYACAGEPGDHACFRNGDTAGDRDGAADHRDQRDDDKQRGDARPLPDHVQRRAEG